MTATISKAKAKKTATRKAKPVSFSSKVLGDSIVIELNCLNGKPLPEEKALEYFRRQMQTQPSLQGEGYGLDYAIQFPEGEGDWDDFLFGDSVEHCGTEYEVLYNSRIGCIIFYNSCTDSICDVFCDDGDTTINTIFY